MLPGVIQFKLPNPRTAAQETFPEIPIRSAGNPGLEISPESRLLPSPARKRPCRSIAGLPGYRLPGQTVVSCVPLPDGVKPCHDRPLHRHSVAHRLWRPFRIVPRKGTVMTDSSEQARKMLADHAHSLASRTLHQLFDNDPGRFADLSLTQDDMLLDFSRNRLTTETLGPACRSRPRLQSRESPRCDISRHAGQQHREATCPAHIATPSRRREHEICGGNKKSSNMDPKGGRTREHTLN